MYFKYILFSNLISLATSNRNHKFIQIKEDVGINVNFEDFPFILGLQRIEGSLVCAAVLISGRYSMTACKCLAKPGDQSLPAPHKFRVIGGVSKRGPNEVSENFEIRIPDGFYAHPNFSQGLFTNKVYDNDIVVIEVKKPFPTTLIRPVSLYLPSDSVHSIVSMVGMQKIMKFICLVIGWRRESVFVEQISQSLVGHAVTLLGNKECFKAFCRYGPDMCKESLKKEDQLICGEATTKEVSCSMDPAGVLMCDGSFIGFLSWKPRCGFARGKIPNIFNAFWPSVDFLKNFTADSATVHRPRPIFLSAVVSLVLRSFKKWQTI